MSLLPLPYLMDLDEGHLNHPFHHRQQRHHQCYPFVDFAHGINPHELNALLEMPPALRHRHQCARDMMHRKGCKDLITTSTTGKNGFQVLMDVQQFSPKEILVKTFDNCVIVEGTHEERPDEHGFISRQFTRRYELPEGYDPDTVTSSLSSDGVLTIAAPNPKALENLNKRLVSIQLTGPARLNVKDNHHAGDEEEKKVAKNDK